MRTRKEEEYLAQLPPHSTEAEKGVLGCMLLDPSEATTLCVEKINGYGAESFYDLRNRALFGHLVAMHESKQPIDLITLHQRLKDNGQVEEVGGMSYVSGLMDAVPSASNAAYYAEILCEKFVRRKIAVELQVMRETVQSDCQQSSEEVIDKIDRMSNRLRSLVEHNSEAVNIKDKLRELIDLYQKADNGIRIPSVPTGFKCIEDAIGGFRAGELIAIGARAKVGKTTLGVNIAQHAAFHGYPCAIFSLEMKASELLQRMVASESGVPVKDAENGWTNDEQKKKMATAMAKISRAPISMMDQFTISVDQVAQQCRKWKKEKGIKLVVIDYLQLMDRPRDVRPVEAIAEITRKLKNLAGDLDLAIIIVSQLNRQCESEHRAPMLSDFRDSGSIEQDANLIFMLHENRNDKSKVHLRFTGRRCKSDEAVLLFHRDLNRFENEPITP